MKKLIVALLMLTLLLPAAMAEEKPFLGQTPLENYLNASSLTGLEAAQVCITPYSGSSLFESTYKEPWYVSFPFPADTVPLDFGMSDFSLINPEHDIQYFFRAVDSAAYETFLNQCDVESDILLDGSDKTAAYIRPDKTRAYGLIGVPEIEKGAKLYIEIYYGGLRRAEDAEKREKLSSLILEEVQRIKEQMTVEKKDSFWTQGLFAGVRLPARELGKGAAVSVTLADITLPDEQGESMTAPMFLTKVDGQRATAYAAFGQGRAVSFDLETGTYSYVNSNKESKPDEIVPLTLKDGTAWEAYVSNLNADGTLMSVYLHRVLDDTQEKPCYLTLHVSFRHVSCPDLDALTALLDTLCDAGILVEK